MLRLTRSRRSDQMLYVADDDAWRPSIKETGHAESNL